MSERMTLAAEVAEALAAERERADRAEAWLFDVVSGLIRDKEEWPRLGHLAKLLPPKSREIAAGVLCSAFMDRVAATALRPSAGPEGTAPERRPAGAEAASGAPEVTAPERPGALLELPDLPFIKEVRRRSAAGDLPPEDLAMLLGLALGRLARSATAADRLATLIRDWRRAEFGQEPPA